MFWSTSFKRKNIAHAITMNFKQSYYAFCIFLSVIFSVQSIFQNDTQFQINITLTKLQNIFDRYYPNGQGNVLFVIQFDPNNLSDKLMKYIAMKNVNLIVLNIVNGCDVDFLIHQNSKINFGHTHLIYYFTENSAEKLNTTFKCYEETNLWKPRVKTIVVFSEIVNQTDIVSIFKDVCWKRKILNLVILFPSENTISIFSYNPYFENWYQEISDENIFYDKLKNLNGYKIHILLIKPDDNTKVKLEYNKETNETKYTAKDGLTIRNILRAHNATYDVLDIQGMIGWKNPFRSTYRNAKENEKLEIMRKYDIDLFFLSQEMMANNNVSEMIYPHAKDDWVLLFAHSSYASQYDLLYSTFKNGLGIILGFFLIICPIIWFFIFYVSMKINRRRINKLDSFTLLTINNFRLMLGSGINNIYSNFTTNIFLIFILYCDLIINNYFQSILYSILTVANRLPEINTIIDYIKSPLFIVETAQSLYNEIKLNFDKTSLEGLLKKFVLLDNILSFPNNTNFFNNNRTVGLFLNQDRAGYICARRPLFRIMKESILPAYITFHVAKHSPYYELLENLIPRFMESGLYTYWMKSTLYSQVLQEGRIIEDDEVNGYNDLTLHQFRAAIYLLLLGLLCSVLIFVCECVVGCLKKCNRNVRYLGD